MEMTDLVVMAFWVALVVAGGAALWHRFMHQQCAECTSWVDNRASRCKHCGSEL